VKIPTPAINDKHKMMTRRSPFNGSFN
jgi:hypothetical protein